MLPHRHRILVVPSHVRAQQTQSEDTVSMVSLYSINGTAESAERPLFPVEPELV